MKEATQVAWMCKLRGFTSRQLRDMPGCKTTSGLHLMGFEYRIRSIKHMTLREKLIVLRDKAGISQMSLAHQLDVSRRAVSAGKVETYARPRTS